MSHPTMGAWIEIFRTFDNLLIASRRTPRWVRGLKLYLYYTPISMYWSHPTMGAWIEITYLLASFLESNCRTPRWVRGLKYTCTDTES